MLKQRYKPYKKTYRKGEKVYHLYMYCSWNNALVLASLHQTTVLHIHHLRGKRFALRLRQDNSGEDYINRLEWIAPRTPEGKKFLQARAKSIINAKMGNLMKEAKLQQKRLQQLIDIISK